MFNLQPVCVNIMKWWAKQPFIWLALISRVTSQDIKTDLIFPKNNCSKSTNSWLILESNRGHCVTDSMAKGIEIKRSKLLKNSIKLSPRCRRVIKYLIVLLCVSGLAFQVTQLVLQYLSRRTIVHLEFETLWYNRLPAITICYPNMIAMNKTAERFAQLKPVYNQYKKRLAEANDYEFHDRKLRQKLDDIYENDFLGFIRRQNLSFAQLAELSIPFTYKERVYTQPSLSSKTLNPSEHA